MIRRLTVWIAAMTVAMLMMAVVLAGAAKARPAPGEQQALAWSAQGG